MNEIPYSGGSGELMKDLLGGHIDLVAATMSSIAPQVKSGQLHAIAVMAPTRNEALPDVPTTVEAGYPNLLSTLWFGFAVPKGTPDDVVEKLRSAIEASVNDPAISAEFHKRGVAPKPSRSAPEFWTHVQNEMVRWKPIADRGK
jgi:tripartite-type tricarboxylate transporter receptor subunit TctC